MAAGLLVLLSGSGSVTAPTAAAPVSTVVDLCPSGGMPPVVPGAPWACAHADEPPAGIDPHRPVATTALQDRDGAADEAVAAATALGAPAVVATTSTVPCDGDGTSGYRVQAMYVVAAGQTNRYASVAASIQQWAAGVDEVVNRSAALTGGVRHVRFVSAPNGDGTCSPTVLNVTVPTGADASFGATVTAVSNLGFTSGDRKYLMWVDATVLCGIAQMYPYSDAGQDNVNNGLFPQMARIDSGCWGLGQSVEAHELVHTLGAVMPDAPHATVNGHCTDDADRLCYVDGPGVAMQQVCVPESEALLDCNGDDYFSTAPPAGSYLASHWNAAGSRFLIDGGAAVARWTPNVVVSGTSAATVTYGQSVTVTGSVTRVSGALTDIAPALPLTVVQSRAGFPDAVLGATTTRADGTYSVAVRPTATSSVTVRVASVPGYDDATSTDVQRVTVRLASALTPSTTRPRRGALLTWSVRVAPARTVAVRLQRRVSGAWVTVALVPVVAGHGAIARPAPASAGTYAYRLWFAGDSSNAAAASPVRTIAIS